MPKLRTRGIVTRDGYYGQLRKGHKCTYTNIPWKMMQLLLR